MEEESVMKRLLKKMLLCLVVTLLAVGMVSSVYAKQIKLSTKKVTLRVTRTKVVTIKNIKVKQIKSVKVKSSKKSVATASKKSKTKIKIKAKKKGSAKITVTIKYKKNKKIKTKKLKVAVKVLKLPLGADVGVKKVMDSKDVVAVLRGSLAKLKGNSGLKYDNKEDIISGVKAGDKITYTVPKINEGDYDIYLEIGKSDYVAGETMFSVDINGKHFCIPAKVLQGNKNEIGKFLMANNVKLKEGDEITVNANFGYTNLPFIGDISIYEAGVPAPTGYDGNVKQAEETDPTDVLSGKTIVWLGSSVTYGYGSGGYTMADEIERKHKNTTCYKYAINGTTLVNESDSSYVARMKNDISKDMKIDLLVVQLSTNDASQNKPLGVISDSNYNDKTVVGAIETIIDYAKKTWNCPVAFYTGTKYDNPNYKNMVNALYGVRDKWHIGLVDLWGDSDMNKVSNTSALYKSYMKDPIHPTKKGYVDWWTPKFEAGLTSYLKSYK